MGEGTLARRSPQGPMTGVPLDRSQQGQWSPAALRAPQSSERRRKDGARGADGPGPRSTAAKTFPDAPAKTATPLQAFAQSARRGGLRKALPHEKGFVNELVTQDTSGECILP
jgi:hypothetical protein